MNRFFINTQDVPAHIRENMRIMSAAINELLQETMPADAAKKNKSIKFFITNESHRDDADKQMQTDESSFTNNQ